MAFRLELCVIGNRVASKSPLPHERSSRSSTRNLTQCCERCGDKLTRPVMQYEFSLPTSANKVPAGPDWIHEIKYDGYRMLVIREQDRVRLISRGGYDWSDRFPLIEAGALKLPQEDFVIDGEVVVLRSDGLSDFDALSSRKHDKRAMLYAFDLLAGESDLREMPLSLRKDKLAQLLSRPVDGIFIADYEQRDIGDKLFRAACKMGLEGIVSKRLDRSYGAGRCKHWIKIKNRAHPAYSRVRDTIIASLPKMIRSK
jgi:bifunctional non-homologous end joining protein LigD